MWYCEEHGFRLHNAVGLLPWEGSPTVPAQPLPAGACCGSGAGAAWSRRPRAVSGGDAGAEAGPAHPRLPLTPVVCSPLSLQTQRCWGHPTRSWRPPWASPASVRGDAAGGAGSWLAERAPKPWGLSAPGGPVFQSPFASFPGKKARTFDLEAMFEQTRRTAVERSRKVLGKKCERSRLLHFKTCFDLLPQGDV